MDSESSSLKRADNRSQEDKNMTSKLFISNLDGKADIQELERDLRSMFQKCGNVQNIAAKRSRTEEYCFAFVEMQNHAAAKQCIRECNKTNFNGKNILVEFQDVTKCHRGRKEVGCFTCGKTGHFARECPNGRDGGGRRGYHRRSRSPSEDSRRRHKRHKRRRSSSSDRGRSRSPKPKKHRKHSSRDDKQKRKRKHKKSYSSDS